jgi:PBP1b-binding outer membrane lipoprotein LpoB
MKRIALVFLSAVLLSGCSIRLGSFTIASTKNIGYTYRPLQRDVTGEDCVNMILFVPIGTLNPNLQDAVDRAVAKVPNGDMMTNVTAYTDFLFTLVYNRRCVRVVGDVVDTDQSPTTTQPAAK